MALYKKAAYKYTCLEKMKKTQKIATRLQKYLENGQYVVQEYMWKLKKNIIIEENSWQRKSTILSFTLLWFTKALMQVFRMCFL